MSKMFKKKIFIFLPIQIVSEANDRSHWRIKNQRKTAQQKEVSVLWRNSKEKVELPCKVIFTRYGKQQMDSDNLAGAFKAVRDQLAKEIGIDDGSDLITFEYRQVKLEKNEHKISIEIEDFFMNEQTKICISEFCELKGEPQPKDNFSLDFNYVDNRKTRCKKCVNRKNKQSKARLKRMREANKI